MDRYRGILKQMKIRYEVNDKYAKPIILLSLYLFANLFLITNYAGLYWDDWVAYKQNASTLETFFSELQHGIKGQFYIAMASIGNGIWSFRIFSFFAYLLMGFFIYKTLLTVKQVTEDDAFAVAAVFLMFPLIEVKVAASIVPFLFPVLLFFAAFYLSTLVDINRLPGRALVVLLFLLSFSTNSTYSFYYIFLIYLYGRTHEFLNFKLTNIIFFARRNFDLILFPFVAFVIKAIYFKPYGLYAGYNGLKFQKDNFSLEKIIASYKTVLFGQYNMPNGSLAWLVVLILVAMLAFNLTVSMRGDGFKTSWKALLEKIAITPLLVTCFGMALIFLAMLPYMAVGKSLTPIGKWDSRFMLLAPLGYAFFLVYGLKLIGGRGLVLSKKQQQLVLLVVCSVFAFVTNAWNREYLKDWFYQTAIRYQFAKSQEIRSSDTFYVAENLTDVMTGGRRFNLYEWNGLLKSAFGDEKRLMISSHDGSIDFERYKGSFKNYRQYNFGDWNESSDALCVSVLLNKAYMDEKFNSLYFNYLFKQKKYDHQISDVALIKVNKLNANCVSG